VNTATDAREGSAAGDRPLPAPRFEALYALARSPSFIVGAAILLFWIACALFGPLIVPLDPYASDPLNSLAPPSAAHWFGTDQLGRDVFSRVIVGARDILTIAPLATLVGTVAGASLGLIVGYFGGWLDNSLGRLIDALLALPLVVLALAALAALGASNATVVLVIGLTFMPITARTVRAAVLSERHLDYVDAAQLRGEGALYIMFFEILPNVLPPIIVEATVRLGYAIFAVATLSFLGFGIQPPSADWGLALSESYALMTGGAWWTVVFDAAAIATLVVGVNLVADSVQGVLNR
jgi:peptide/nickel transport system permease protein